MSKWEKVRLGDVCDVRDGTHDSPRYVKFGIPLITSRNLSRGYIDFENVNLISDEDYKKISVRSFVDDGDILMPMIGTIGNPIIVDKDREFAIKNVSLIKFNNINIYNKYIYYILTSVLFRKYVSSENKGGTQKFISLGSIRKFLFPLPPLEVQKQIASTLDVASDLLTMRKQQLAELDELIKSVFYEMFGDPVTNEREWRLVPFTDIVVLQRGYDLPVQNRDAEGIVPVYGSNGIVGNNDAFKARSGGVITGRSGTIGNVYYTFGDYWPLNTTLYSADLKGNNIIYLAYLLKYFNLKRFSSGTGVPTLNRNIINKENVYSIPLELQNQFADIVTKIEEQKALVKQAIDETQQLFDSLMSQYFDN